MTVELVIKPRRDVGLLRATSIMMGTIIGSGIFVSPTSVIINTGSVGLALIVWAISGLLMLGIILSYIELALIYPKAGGEYNFYKQILGDLPAFLAGYLYIVIAAPAFLGLLSLTTANYLISPFFHGCEMPRGCVVLLSIWIFATILAVNATYVKYVAKVQIFFTAVKVIALVVIIVVGLIEIGKGNVGMLESAFEDSSTNPGGHAVAVYAGFFSYGGWQFLFVLLEEVKNPEKILPAACIGSMVSVIVLYILTNVAYFSVMTPAEMMASPAVAVTFAERTLGEFSYAIPLCVACSTIGALNGALLGLSRMPYALARDGMFPEAFGTINIRFFNPWISLLFYTVFSLIVIATGEAVKLAEYLGFMASLITFISLCCVVFLRWKKPEITRPFKVPIPVTVFLCVFMLGLLIMGIYQEPRTYGMGVLILLTGIPVYFIGVTWKNKPKYFIQKMRRITILLQKLFLVTAADLD